MTIAPFIRNAPNGLFDYIQQALGSLSVPILAVVLIGILTKKVPAIGAKIALIGGVLMYLVGLFVIKPNFIKSALDEAAAAGITDTVQLDLIASQAYPHFLYVMAFLFALNVVIMLVIGLIKPKTETYVPTATTVIDVTPWKYAWIVGVLIVLLVLSTYLIF
jgi:SSS family solute:Na+ symporter